MLNAFLAALAVGAVTAVEPVATGDLNEDAWKRDGDKWSCVGVPGPKRIRGPEAMLVRTDVAPASGTVTLSLENAHFGKETSVWKRVSAPWRPTTHLEFGLDRDTWWYARSIEFKADGEMPDYRLLGLDEELMGSAAEALRADVETNNPWHLVREAKGEKAVFVFRNPTDRDLAWDVTTTIENFRGEKRRFREAIELKAGAEMHRPFADGLGMGIRYVTVMAAAEGECATNNFQFAYVDLHEVTPLQPEDEFRMGFNMHLGKVTANHRERMIGAAVALGAKLCRTNILRFRDNWPSEDKVDFSKDEELIDKLLANGIALNAIMWGTPSWAILKDAGGAPMKGRELAVRPGLLRRYGEMMGERLGTKVSYYEVGNEWDMSNPKTFPFEDAVRSVREFAEGVKSKCPEAKVINPGFAAESSTRHPPDRIRRNFQEDLMVAVQDVVDAHAIHVHTPIGQFFGQMDYCLKWRKERGINPPIYCNETALSSMGFRPTDRGAASVVWKKILFALSRGSIDYIWYNLRATGYEPRDNEQGYGVFTPDWHPRSTAAAFSALAANIRHLAADGMAFDGDHRKILRLKGVRDGKPSMAYAGWDDFAAEPKAVRIRTDAESAYEVDLMGNRAPVEIRDGVALWHVTADPSAICFPGATKAEIDAADAKDAATPLAKRIKAVQSAELEREERPDSGELISDYEYVHEFWQGMPEHVNRVWRWWGDIWVWMKVARHPDGRLTIRLTNWDDVHHPEPDAPLSGDAAVLRFGDWRILLVGTKPERMQVLAKPRGAKEPDLSKWKFEMRTGYHKAYLFTFDPRDLGFTGSLPFNYRIYDNDGDGVLECWMEPAPLDEPFHPYEIEL